MASLLTSRALPVSKQEDSPFFNKFPPEIRNKIYKAYRDLLLQSSDGSITITHGLFNSGQRVSEFPRLMMTCKRLAKEADSILFTKAHLQFNNACFRPRSDLTIKAPGNWQPSRYEEISLKLIPSSLGWNDFAMGIELQILFMRPSNTKIKKITLRFDFRHVTLYCSHKIRVMEMNILPQFLGFARPLPHLKEVELRGVFPEHWIGLFQSQLRERGAPVTVSGIIDPVPSSGSDLCYFMRVDGNYQRIS
ncbi:hypothetical protein SLS62_007926 [Diatrype stigma]|uniref:Uncharacterized protein n=1 Tax=Diatrype stigma TaxID=117547 RepID=A0AAN9UQ18_9PEZI